jgi:putative transposase
VARYLTFYNQTRPHQALDGQTPDQVYYDNLTTRRDRRVVNNPPGAT